MTTRITTIPADRLWLGLAAIVILPFAEFLAFFWVAGQIGLPMALILLIATSFLGVSLLRRQGKTAFSRLMRSLSGGTVEKGAARESLLLALGGVLMIIPGFVTDVIGFALMLPGLLRHWGETQRQAPVVRPRAQTRTSTDKKVIDLDRNEWKPVDE
jgi:UPF0716 protein FxsA